MKKKCETWKQKGRHYRRVFRIRGSNFPHYKLKIIIKLFASKNRIPAKNIPTFVVSYYNETGNNDIPQPRIKESKEIGSTTELKLVWEDNSSLPIFTPTEHFTDIGGTQSGSCRTTKDKDKRTHR